MAMTDVELAKFFLVLKLYNEEFNVEFLASVVSADEPTERQLVGLNKCVTGLRLKEKIAKYDTDGFVPYFKDEVDFEDVTSNEVLYCYATDKSVEFDERLLFNTEKKRFISVEEFKKTHLIKKPIKKKLVLSSL
jgi:hypothetical protein